MRIEYEYWRHKNLKTHSYDILSFGTAKKVLGKRQLFGYHQGITNNGLENEKHRGKNAYSLNTVYLNFSACIKKKKIMKD